MYYIHSKKAGYPTGICRHTYHTVYETQLEAEAYVTQTLADMLTKEYADDVEFRLSMMDTDIGVGVWTYISTSEDIDNSTARKVGYYFQRTKLDGTHGWELVDNIGEFWLYRTYDHRRM